MSAGVIAIEPDVHSVALGGSVGVPLQPTMANGHGPGPTPKKALPAKTVNACHISRDLTYSQWQKWFCCVNRMPAVALSADSAGALHTHLTAQQ